VVSEEFAERAGTAMLLDNFTWDSYIPGCKFIANVCFALRAQGGKFPESTVQHVVSGLEVNTLCMNNNVSSSGAVPTSSKYTYQDSKELAVMAGVSALKALVMHRSDIQAVFDAGGMRTLIMALMRYGDHMHVCQRVCCVLNVLAPFDAEKGVFWEWEGLQKVTNSLHKHRASLQMQTHAIALLAAFVLPSPCMQKIFLKVNGVHTLRVIMDRIASLKDRETAETIIKACSP
jgi:hypothetical protein